MTFQCLTLTYDEFVSKYQPINNTLNDNASFDGYLFETYGHEHVYVRQQCDLNIWTILDCDGGTCICSGYSFVNRIGYIITTLPWDENQHISVDLED